MRSWAGLGVLAAQVACATSTAEPAVVMRPVVAAPQPSPDPPAAVRVAEPVAVVPDRAEDEQARVLAEVGAMDPAARWAWAVSVMPELAAHREEDPGPAAWAAFHRHAAGRRALWVRTRGARCFAARGAWEEQSFFGRARVSTRIRGDTKSVEYESVEIDAGSITVSGPHGEVFTRDARGRWQLSGGHGVGSMAALAERPVSEFRRGAAYYGGQDYTVTVECVGRISYEERCTDGTTRRCARCGGLVDRIHAVGMYRAGSGVGWSTSSTPRDCSEPCPPDVHGPRIAALGLVVAGRRFHAVEAPVAAVYTSRAACESDRRMARARRD